MRSKSKLLFAIIFLLISYNAASETNSLYFVSTCSDVEYSSLVNENTGLISEILSKHGITCIFPDSPDNSIDKKISLSKAYALKIPVILFSQVIVDGENLIIESELVQTMSGNTLKKITSGGELNLGSESKWTYIINKIIPVIQEIETESFPAAVAEKDIESEITKPEPTHNNNEAVKKKDETMPADAFESAPDNVSKVVDSNNSTVQNSDASINKSARPDSQENNIRRTMEFGVGFPTGYNLSYLPGKYISNGVSQYISFYGETLLGARNLLFFGLYYGIGYCFSVNFVDDFSYRGDIRLQSHYLTAQIGLHVRFTSNWFLELGTKPEWIVFSYYSDSEGSEALPITDFPVKFPIQISAGYERLLKHKTKYQLGLGVQYKPVSDSVLLFELLLVQRFKF